jgi:hypothetical protein
MHAHTHTDKHTGSPADEEHALAAVAGDDDALPRRAHPPARAVHDGRQLRSGQVRRSCKITLRVRGETVHQTLHMFLDLKCSLQCLRCISGKEHSKLAVTRTAADCTRAYLLEFVRVCVCVLACCVLVMPITAKHAAETMWVARRKMNMTV